MSEPFPMPSIADFQAMSATDFESFWRLYAASFKLSPVDLERSIALKHAGWLPLGDSDSHSRAILALWAWHWEPHFEPQIGRAKLQMMQAYRDMMKAKTGFDPDDPNYGSDRLRTLGEVCPFSC